MFSFSYMIKNSNHLSPWWPDKNFLNIFLHDLKFLIIFGYDQNSFFFFYKSSKYSFYVFLSLTFSFIFNKFPSYYLFMIKIFPSIFTTWTNRFFLLFPSRIKCLSSFSHMIKTYIILFLSFFFYGENLPFIIFFIGKNLYVSSYSMIIISPYFFFLVLYIFFILYISFIYLFLPLDQNVSFMFFSHIQNVLTFLKNVKMKLIKLMTLAWDGRKF